MQGSQNLTHNPQILEFLAFHGYFGKPVTLLHHYYNRILPSTRLLFFKGKYHKIALPCSNSYNRFCKERREGDLTIQNKYKYT